MPNLPDLPIDIDYSTANPQVDGNGLDYHEVYGTHRGRPTLKNTQHGTRVNGSIRTHVPSLDGN